MTWLKVAAICAAWAIVAGVRKDFTPNRWVSALLVLAVLLVVVRTHEISDEVKP